MNKNLKNIIVGFCDIFDGAVAVFTLGCYRTNTAMDFLIWEMQWQDKK